MANLTYNITEADQKSAKKAVIALRRSAYGSIVRDSARGTVPVYFEHLQTQLDIPEGAFELLVKILNYMKEGKSLSLVAQENEISTQHAAEMLNVSRPHVVKLLENGEIPFHKVGSHRRIKLDDLLAYQRKIQEEREKALQDLANEAQDLDLGY